jgi:hypothetical protein
MKNIYLSLVYCCAQAVKTEIESFKRTASNTVLRKSKIIYLKKDKDYFLLRIEFEIENELERLKE